MAVLEVIRMGYACHNHAVELDRKANYGSGAKQITLSGKALNYCG